MLTRCCMPSVCVLFMLLGEAAWGGITTSLNRNYIDIADSLTLTVRVDEQASQEPDFDRLDADWHTQQTSKNSTVNVVNGRFQSSTVWHLTLTPKRTGSLMIPELTWRGARSNPIRVQVSPVATDLKQRLAQLAFFKTKVSAGPVWVQSQVLYEVTLYYSQEIQLARSLDAPTLQNSIVKRLQSKPETGVKHIQGVRYGFITQHYAIFPQASGRLEIAPETNSVYAHLPKYGGKRFVLTSSGHSIKVLPKPPEYPANQPWLPAQDLSISGAWSEPVNSLEVGKATNLQLVIQAQGLLASLLPTLPKPELRGARIYDHPTTPHESLDKQGIISRLTANLAIVPTQVGALVFPETRVTWWDVKQRRVRKALWPAQSLQVAASGGGAALHADGTQYAADDPMAEASGGTGGAFGIWGWLSLLLALAWVGTLLYAQRLAGRLRLGQEQRAAAALRQQEDESQSFRRLARVCRQQHAADMRLCLQSWARHYQPTSATPLSDLVADDPQAQALIGALDEHLYQDAAVAVDAAAILAWVKQRRSKQPKKTGQRIALAPLYPEALPRTS